MTSAQPRPRFGVFLPAWVLPGEAAPAAAHLQDFARRAEDVGFDSVWVFDHLFEAPPSYRVVFMEPLTSLALAVAATRRVALGTGILVLPLRDPVVTAKAVANLDAVSGGRVVFGVGVGWDETEFRACQVPKETRGRRMDEMLEIINGLWTQDTFAYDGRYFTVPEVRLLPRPVQTPRPPILVAGGLVPAGTSKHITSSRGYTAQRSLQRAATLGDGLMTAYRSAPGLDMSQLAASWDVVRAEARAAGRDPRSLRFAHQDHLHIDPESTPERLARVLARFSHNRYEDSAAMYLMGRPEDLVPRFQARIDAGVDEIAFSVLSGDPGQLDLFMKEIRPHLRPRLDRQAASRP
ncbi:MAG: LLM class flavin-dependent oxidoreductase [Candidatus Rokuibacteriota bacterium]